jgi:hypothetical protein
MAGWPTSWRVILGSADMSLVRGKDSASADTARLDAAAVSSAPRVGRRRLLGEEAALQAREFVRCG